MTIEKAIRLARKWAAGHVCTLKEGEAQEYHQMCAEALEKSHWISVEEALPERGEFVLLSYAKNCKNPTQFAKNTMAVGRYDYGMFLVEGCEVSVTHWMPLPEPPTEEEV